MEEASRGYFHDYNIAKREGGGKQWVAPKVLIREDVSDDPAVASTWAH